MLKTIRKYRRSVLGVVGIGLIALSMGGFGVNLASNKGSGTYAIKVGDQEISYEEYAEARRQLDSRYRKMLGDNYAEMLKSFNINIAQQAVDNTINNSLLDQFASKMGLEGSSKSVQEMIHNQLFAGEFDAQRYAEFLSSQGLTAVKFENSLRKDIARQQLVDLISDASLASNSEARTMLLREKTRYSFKVLSLSAEQFVSQSKEPDSTLTAKYYDDNLTDFQIPAKVSYNYIVLEPKDFLTKVPYTEEDIELEYSDNPSAYQTEPEVRLSQIVLNFSDKNSQEQKEKTRKTAQDILGKIKSGEKFEDLAKTYSQDPISAIKAGDSGWKNKDLLPKAVAEKAFSADLGSISDSIETDSAIYIIRVEDRKDASLRPLAEVRDQIIKKIQDRDAASVLAVSARDLFDAWINSQKSLNDFSKENSLGSPKASELLSKEKDPAADLKGLTDNILSSKESKQQIIEIGDRQILVEISELKDESVEPLETATKKINSLLKEREAKELARVKADEILAGLNNNQYSNLDEAANKNSFKTEEIVEVTSNSSKGAVADPQVRDKVFSFKSAPQKPNEVFNVAGNFVLVEVTSIKQPEPSEIESNLENMKKGLGRDSANFSLEAFIARLKNETKIDVQPALLTE